MIAIYEFIDANSSGYKERKLSATTELYNKLSAQETNNFKDKLNEVIAAANALTVAANTLHPATTFKFIQKGFGNSDPLNFEIGDYFCGYKNDGTERYVEATWQGGDLTDSANFTPTITTSI